MAKAQNRGTVSKMRETQVNPIPVIAGFVIVALGLAYFFWLRPSMETNKIQKEWTKPEQAALRAPGAKPAVASHEQFLADLRAKNGKANAGAHERRRDTE